jgi:hypothetical protein
LAKTLTIYDRSVGPVSISLTALAILGTQDIGQINVRENPRGNQEKDNPETLAILGTQDIVSGLSFS